MLGLQPQRESENSTHPGRRSGHRPAVPQGLHVDAATARPSVDSEALGLAAAHTDLALLEDRPHDRVALGGLEKTIDGDPAAPRG